MPLGEPAYDGREHHPRLGGGSVEVVAGEQLADRRLALTTHGLVQRGRLEAAEGRRGVAVLRDRRAELVGDLLLRRLAPVVLGEPLDDLVDPPLELLDATRGPHRPALVAEVALQLAADGRHGVREQVVAQARVEAVDGLGQAFVGHLAQVILRDTPVAEAGGDGLGDPPVDDDDAAQRLVDLLGVRAVLGGVEQPGGLLGAFAAGQRPVRAARGGLAVEGGRGGTSGSSGGSGGGSNGRGHRVSPSRAMGAPPASSARSVRPSPSRDVTG